MPDPTSKTTASMSVGSVVFGPKWDKPTAVGASDSNTFIAQPVYRHELEKLLAELEARLAAAGKPQGCVCPAGAEKTCKGWACPRQAVRIA